MVSYQSSPSGRHVLIDGYGVDLEILNDQKVIELAIRSAIQEGDVTLLTFACHAFSPQGLTAFALLTESHIAIHTWPERNYFTADIYFCNGKIDLAVAALLDALKPKDVKITQIDRGGGLESPTLNRLESTHV